MERLNFPTICSRAAWKTSCFVRRSNLHSLFWSPWASAHTQTGDFRETSGLLPDNFRENSILFSRKNKGLMFTGAVKTLLGGQSWDFPTAFPPRRFLSMPRNVLSKPTWLRVWVMGAWGALSNALTTAWFTVVSELFWKILWENLWFCKEFLWWLLSSYYLTYSEVTLNAKLPS